MDSATLAPERPVGPAGRRRTDWQKSAGIAVWGLLLLAVIYTLYFAAAFLKPVVGAVLLNLVFSPMVRGLRRYLRLPAPLGAAILVGALCAGFAGGTLILTQPANEWLRQVPQVMSTVGERISDLKAPVEDVRRATRQVEDAIEVDDSSERPSVEVEIRQPGIFEILFGTVRQVTLQMGVCLILLFFLLASDQLFKEKLVHAMLRFGDKRNALLMIRQIEQEVATYLLTITVINACLGAIIGAGLLLIGLPNPLLWGAMAAGLNFIPYLGALVGVVVVAAVGLVSFDQPYPALMAAAVYGGVNFLEAYIVTPMVLGRRLTLNAIVIFVVVAFCGWLWGVAGALMAVPLLVVFKAACDQFEAMAPISEFLSGR